MNDIQKISICARQMQRICSSIDECATAIDPIAVKDDDPFVIQMLLNQLELAQQLILELTKSIMEVSDCNDINSGEYDGHPNQSSADGYEGNLKETAKPADAEKATHIEEEE